MLFPAPVDYQTTFSNPTSYQTLPTPASCQSPLPYPNSQPITFSAEDFQFPLQSFVPVASADVTLQKLLTTVTELTKEVKDLRQDFREFRQSCRCGQSAGVVGLTEEPLQLPLHCMEELENAEVILQSQEARKAMVARFTVIGGTTLEIRVRRMLAYSMTNELASGLNWAGKKNKDVAKQKRPFKEMALCKCMFDALTQRLSTANTYEFAQAVQKCATPQTELEELDDRRRVSVKATLSKRTKINEELREKLKQFFNEGMTQVGSPLIKEAAIATGLETCVIENWIGNHKRVVAPSQPRPAKRKWHVRELSAYNLFCRDLLKNKGREAKERYGKEAAALWVQEPKLEAMGVETAMVSIDKLSCGTLEVFEVSSKEAAVFLDTSDTSSKFAMYFKAGFSRPVSSKEDLSVLHKKVQELFNTKYKEAGGAGRVPYKSLQGRPVVVAGLQLKKPMFYGRNQLEAILKCHNEISFHIRGVDRNDA
ncbi:uncharacterized protein LOC143133510 [Alosa pseudoharengus]|uniref:uncharacterized protein LOC143133510 n=1 Tax=Alosa pseudoharengus TaxID=34774 RepID=UPI003F8865B1